MLQSAFFTTYWCVLCTFSNYDVFVDYVIFLVAFKCT